MKKQGLKRAIAISASAALVLLGLLFIISAVHLFLIGGDRPYTRERAGDYLLPLIPSAAITAALVVFGAILSYIDRSSAPETSRRSSLERLRGYKARFEGIGIPEQESAVVKKESRRRLLINILAFSLSALLALGAFVYVICFAEFTVGELSSNVLSAFSVALPLLIISVGIHIPKAYLLNKSAEVEYDALRSTLTKGVRISPPKAPRSFAGEDKLILGIKLGALAVAVIFVAVGIINGGMEDVLGKAVKICTECIGLG